MENFKIFNLLFNIDFWSAFVGFLGTILIFFFGLPPKIDQEGHSHLLLEGTDEGEKRRARIYKYISYGGILLLSISFLLQLLKLFFGF